jgi:hypothetical protein
MKRCPKCNRTYANDTQKFCTKDGTGLVAQSAPLGETVRLDSSELSQTQDDPEVTKVISRELPTEPSGDFDPYKTIVAQPDPYKTIVSKPDKTTADLSGTTGDLMPASIPPQPLSGMMGGAGSGPVGPPQPPRRQEG